MADASPLTVFTMAINFTLGAGVLGIPYSIAHAGLLASALTLVAVAAISLLTSSWLLEVCDRANAVQNELSRRTIVTHADGTESMLPFAESFCRSPKCSAAFTEPLLAKSEQKLDAYRAAYRSWRTGNHHGARDSELRKLMPLLVYQASRHRELYPLQLLPPPPSAGPAPDYELEAAEGAATPNELESLVFGVNPPLGRSTDSSAANSSQSLSALGCRSDSNAGAAAARAQIRRSSSFSVDLAAALLQVANASEVMDSAGNESTDAVVGPRDAGHVPKSPLPPSTKHHDGQSIAERSPFVRWPLREQASTINPPSNAPHCESVTASVSVISSVASSYQPDWSRPSEISALEVAQLCTVFLGRRSRHVWILSVLCLHVAAQWTCAAVWVNTAQVILSVQPLARLALCAFVFVPLSLIGGASALQPPLAVATLSTLVGMVFLLVWALLQPSIDPSGSKLSEPVFEASSTNHTDTHSAVESYPVTTTPFERYVISGPAFGPATSTFLFSYIVQQSVPTLQRAAAHPSTTRRAIAAAIATCCILYLFLGCSAALLFGDHTAKLITLNFGSFRGAASPGVAPLWVRLVGRWVQVLPMLTTTAAFPLFNNVLSSNLKELLPPQLRSQRIAAILCAIPPLLGCAIQRDTSFLFALCGLCGVAVVFIIPAMLQRAARDACVRRWGEVGLATPHSTSLSGDLAVSMVLVIGAVTFLSNAWIMLIWPALQALSRSRTTELRWQGS